MSDRIANAQLRGKVMSAEEAAQFVNHGDKVGVSGFTGAGYPKALPTAIAERAKEAHARGDEYMIDLFTGASTAPDCDGVLAEADALRFRTPYQSDPILRSKINDGTTLYADYHLSELGIYVEQGFFGQMNVAIVEAVRITEEGHIVPSSSVGNNVEYLDNAEKIIIEVNSWQSEELEGMADIYRMNKLPNRQPIPITEAGQRIGTTYIDIDLSKVVAVVETDAPDRNAPFKPLDETSKQIAGHFLDFLEGEVAAGRLSYDGYVMQSGVGNVPNAVMAGLLDSKFENIKAYTEVIQDGMVDLMDAGKMTVASATSFSLSPEYAERMNAEAKNYAQKIIMRPQQISNHPEVVRRLGLICTNGLIEADIYGNVNSTNVTGSRMMNGVGGSADFTRNGFISSFITPSVAKGGDISAFVPFVSHVDHTEQDVKVLISEYGYADLRGLAPRQRVEKIIAIAHPDYRPLLQDYYDRALAFAKEKKIMQTPHLLGEALSFHQRFQETGSMKK
ncbi:Succinyl-CoA:coenzyme A transferase [Corynebacterium diphtheriae subsp. lausannense]|uniref:acetyl-CoA hydrolase/transferase family protein n=1 Tax=Corynebacterium belfantii TaxID=2014537 RepID=UPI0009686FB5|nr:acetyl-CoA hydrolase/transferase family protein [Corynebacterium belfantii]OLN15791.1 propionyl-CoA--succinate CoA transferase [Corynebacterium diphtheriae subsp. lausannense]MBG9244686.1 acetyl-CoA hydrolase/transferase family protein [Corynebacterium belfantii]MBG9310479.1 acetyl-CoA hydrolase/transferase family protein [Corynebacterium belfantii]MBG9334370.1 acetyl-CoA hydrolase/transferase family protein [Corynebacterium belfantii]QBZ29703.1 acetyl-CoA hydrolase/transferase family prote